jgi:transposase
MPGSEDEAVGLVDGYLDRLTECRDPLGRGEGDCVRLSWKDGAQMARPLVSDELWGLIEPLIPVKSRRFRHPGRKRLPDRQVLGGILFVLKTGIPWEHLPQELGCGSGMTCWRRLRDWQQAGVWQALHEVLLAKLNGAEQIDWSRAVVDSSHVRAVLGASKPVPAQSTGARPAPSIS